MPRTPDPDPSVPLASKPSTPTPETFTPEPWRYLKSDGVTVTIEGGPQRELLIKLMSPRAWDDGHLVANSRRLLRVLIALTRLVRLWHGMGMNAEQESEAWDTYFTGAPEMKEVRELLRDLGVRWVSLG